MFNQFNQFNPFATTGFGQFPNAPFNGFGFNPQFTPTATPFNAPSTNWTNATPWFGGNTTTAATTTPWATTPWTNTPWTNTNPWTNFNPWATAAAWNNGFTGFTPWTNTTPSFGSPWANTFGATPWNTNTNWSNQWQTPWNNTFTPWTNGFTNTFTNTFNPVFTNGVNPGFQTPFNFNPTWGATNFNQGNFPFTGNTTGNPVTIDGSDRTGRRGVNFARDAA